MEMISGGILLSLAGISTGEISKLSFSAISIHSLGGFRLSHFVWFAGGVYGLYLALT